MWWNMWSKKYVTHVGVNKKVPTEDQSSIWNTTHLYLEYRRSGNFRVKIIRVKIFHVDKFSRFRSISEIFLTVDDCNMDERLESLWLLVYYQVSGEPGIGHYSHRSDIYLGECGLACKLIHWSSLRNLFFMCLIFAVGLDREIILTAKFSRSTVCVINMIRFGIHLIVPAGSSSKMAVEFKFVMWYA